MDPILRNVISVFAGLIVGSLVNGGLISFTGQWIPPPVGVNPGDIESIKANLHLYEVKHFIFPFLAHALGTLVGAFVTYKIAATHKMKFVFTLGILFLAAGVSMAISLKGPIWFLVVDLLIAYIPMAYLGAKFAKGKA